MFNPPLNSALVDLNDNVVRQLVYLCPADKRCAPIAILLRDFSAEVEAAEITVGWNQDANDVTFEINLGGSEPSSDHAVLLHVGTDNMRSRVVAGRAGQALAVKVTTPEGTSATCVLDVFGFLYDA